MCTSCRMAHMLPPGPSTARCPGHHQCRAARARTACPSGRRQSGHRWVPGLPWGLVCRDPKWPLSLRAVCDTSPGISSPDPASSKPCSGSHTLKFHLMFQQGQKTMDSVFLLTYITILFGLFAENSLVNIDGGLDSWMDRR